ncbi:unnamed protein product [Adineta steineri]|uniref:Uncharacterized protein n=1 Tax=Adineta steineri TaxID=433720 RepID=A0A813P6X6_9BILA|nr:unnamed protein product [Adineta steineri]
MDNNTVHIMAYANNATITTRLLKCDQTLNLTKIIQNLYNLYENINSNIFHNISIIHFDCNTISNKYFEQIITFTKSISIRIQIAFASAYFDYIATNQYLLNGFYIEQKVPFNLSSITLNYTAKSDACSSGERAQDPLCSLNNSISQCINFFSNPWIFNCSIYSTQSMNSSTLIMHNNTLISTLIASVLNSWKFGLICALSILFFLILLCLPIVYFYRRYSRTKHIALSCEYLFDGKRAMEISEIPGSHLFQRSDRTVEPRQSNNTTISWIHDGNTKENYINFKLSKPYRQETCFDHTTVHDLFFLGKSDMHNDHTNVLIDETIPRSICKTSMNQLKLSTVFTQKHELNEHIFDKTDRITLDQSNSMNQKELNESEMTQYINMSFTDEILQDEDAWMSILAVANAELDLLNRLENEQNLTITIN